MINLDFENAPLVVTFEPEGVAVHLFSREVGEQTLYFVARADGTMQDQETETIWDRSTGEATKGQLQGQTLQLQVGSLAFAFAWRAFYPDSRVVRPRELT